MTDPPHAPAGRPGSPARRDAALLLVPPLNARLAQQLAVLLLGHPLAALLDDGAHDTTLIRPLASNWHACARPMPVGRAHANGIGYRPRCPAHPPVAPPPPQRAARPVAPLSWLRRTSLAGTG